MAVKLLRPHSASEQKGGSTARRMRVEGRACQITKVTTGLIFGNQAIPEKGSRGDGDTLQSGRGACLTGSASTGMTPLLGSEQDAMISHPPINTWFV